MLRAIEFDRIKGGKPFDITSRLVRRPARRDRPAGDSGRRRALSPAAGVRVASSACLRLWPAGAAWPGGAVNNPPNAEKYALRLGVSPANSTSR